jgi:prepilin-type N-terminal cleavage/methylation domain-containing protein
MSCAVFLSPNFVHTSHFAVSRSIPSKFARPPSGFTLLEMLVVLALIALVAGLAAPNFGRMLDRYNAATQWREVESAIDDLPYKTFATGQALSLDESNARDLLATLPPDWSITIPKAIRYRETGWCEGGTLTVTNTDGEARTYMLTAPRCEAHT